MKIEDMDFTVRTYNVLKRSGINTSEEIQRMTDDDLYRLRNIGKLTVEEIRSQLPYIHPEKTELPTMTNADRIRAMSDKELAALICKHKPMHSWPEEVRKIYYSTRMTGVEAWTQWLRQPAKEEQP